MPNLRRFQIWAFLTIALFAGSASGSEGKRECRLNGRDNIFEPARWPVASLEKFSDGAFGIVRPTYDHFYLFIVYRRLLGLSITSDDISRLKRYDPCWVDAATDYHGYEPTRSDEFLAAVSTWRVRRDNVPGIPPLGSTIEANRRNALYHYPEFFNCHADAFRTAAKTLESRLARHGQSIHLANWVHAQDMVFANCPSPAGVPDDAPESSPDWLKFDRSYQQAAAAFYSGRYADAIRLFEEIANTNKSPWHQIAPYLSARAMIRSVTTVAGPYGVPVDPEKLRPVQMRLMSMLAEPLDSHLRADVERLLQYLQLRIDPQKVRDTLDERMRALRLPDSIGQDVTDFGLAYKQSETADSTTPFSFWLDAMRGNHDIFSSIDLWRASREIPWLIALLGLVQEESAELDELLAEARDVPPASPAFLTVRYHLMRLTPDSEEAIRIAEDTLASYGTMLSVQDENAFKRVALTRASSLAQFIRFAPRRSSVTLFGHPPNVDEDSIETLNAALPIEVLEKALGEKNLPMEFRKELTQVVWTRAFVLKRWNIARRLAPTIKQMYPEAATLVDDMFAARDDSTREAIGAMLMARYPGMVGNFSPFITYSGDGAEEFASANMHRRLKQDGERANWWCGFPNEIYFARYGRAFTNPSAAAFLSETEKKMLSAERQALGQVANATDYLGAIVMRWAARHPRDPRLPQALHMLVRSTRGGCIDDRNLSAAAFKHLHRHFPNDPWTRKTRVHY
jgi:tetratricopeptide (TPR) repeat protein